MGGVGQDQGELLAANTRGRIDLALAFPQYPRHPLQGGVADLVARAVVDLLETIQVANQDGRLGVSATRPLEL